MSIQTQVIRVEPIHPDRKVIEIAAQAIRDGKLVAFPTETVYGLGANAFDAQAVQRIFTAKGRPLADPLIVHIAKKEDLTWVAKDIPPIAWRLGEKFWPGALTLVLPKTELIPLENTAGLSTVAVRVPAHPVALALLEGSQVPIAAPSANRFGHTSPTTAQHVFDDLAGEIDIILDGGATMIGVESTVLDITCQPAQILRPGGVTLEQLQAVLGEVEVAHVPILKGKLEAIRSPGLLDKHYAPKAKLILFINANSGKALEDMKEIAQEAYRDHQHLGILAVEEDLPFWGDFPADLYSLGEENDLETVASRLYDGLRALDQKEVDLILVRDLGEVGLGLAIRDRLKRASNQVIMEKDD